MTSRTTNRKTCDEHKISSSNENTRSIQSESSRVSASTDHKVAEARDGVFKMIRTHMPIGKIFDPLLKINLPILIADQDLLRKIAARLILIDKSHAQPDEIEKCLKGSPFFSELKQKLEPEHLPMFYKACANARSGEPLNKLMGKAIEGRIFSIKNAMIAQVSPEKIQQSRIQHHLTKKSEKKIRDEGYSFICESLSIHMESMQKNNDLPFEEELRNTAESLVPFIRTVTTSYIKENSEFVAECPEDPIVFRNRTGYNHHGFINATVMKAALEALGYQTRLLGRSDLEPKATLATAHNIVEVTGPNGSKYIVDPTYLQFHKDICISEDELPKNLVLVLQSDKVADYVEKTIIPHWRNTHELFLRNDKTTIKKIENNDQWLVYGLDQLKDLPDEIMPQNLEAWVKSAMVRPWDLDSFSPILSDKGGHQIFHGADPNRQKTFNLVKGMGISSLVTQRDYNEITARLRKLSESSEKNSQEALFLIAQLPRNLKGEFAHLLDTDLRVADLDPCLNAYFRSLAKEVNPEGNAFRVVYGCSGADARSVLLSTNATECWMLDLTNTSFEEFNNVLTRIQSKNASSLKKLEEGLEQESHFVSFRTRCGGAQSILCEGQHHMNNLPLKLFFDLKSMGIDLSQIELSSLKDGTIQIDFPWKYFESDKPKMRSLRFVTADITNVEKYPDELMRAMKEGINAFYMKGAFLVPKYYKKFMPTIAKSLLPNGYLMTADKTIFMETFNPEDYLQAEGIWFNLIKNQERSLLQDLMQPPFSPFLEIPLLRHDRINRNPGTTLDYWANLNVRKKKG